MRALADAAKHDPEFGAIVMAADPDARAALERFDDLDDLVQALVILALARWAPAILGFAMDRAVTEYTGRPS